LPARAVDTGAVEASSHPAGKQESATGGREAPYVETALIAGPFFKTIPWDGRYAPGDPLESFSIKAAQDDAQLDPRDADMPANNPLLAGMRSAARTSDRMAAATHSGSGEMVAGHYFRDLPWSRN
jgi:hypothetical protein